MTAYAISKYGVEAFSDALRRETRPWGVNVSIIEAGAHKTKLVSGDVLINQWQSMWDGLSEEMKQEYGQEGLQKGLVSLKLFDSVASPHIHKVVNSVVHALTSRNPQTRYVIGLDAKALVCLSMLPAGITDFLFSIMALSPEPRLKKNNR